VTAGKTPPAVPCADRFNTYCPCALSPASSPMPDSSDENPSRTLKLPLRPGLFFPLVSSTEPAKKTPASLANCVNTVCNGPGAMSYLRTAFADADDPGWLRASDADCA